MAIQMRKQCAQARAELTREAGDAPAGEFVKRAEAGWAAVENRTRVTGPQWQAMHGMLGGAMPTWKAPSNDEKEAAKRVTRVSTVVQSMQKDLEERLETHRSKAAPAVAWIREREERRGLMRSVLTAWAAARGSQNVPNAHQSHEEWKLQLRRETPRQRGERRIREAVARITTFAQTCFNKFWAEREKQKRTLRVRLAVLRKARVAARWLRVRGEVSRVIWRTRRAREGARRPKRVAALLPDIWEQLRQEIATRRRATQVTVAPRRKARLNLVYAAATGRVMSRVLAHPTGDG